MVNFHPKKIPGMATSSKEKEKKKKIIIIGKKKKIEKEMERFFPKK
jgi:hypothetical protein